MDQGEKIFILAGWLKRGGLERFVALQDAAMRHLLLFQALMTIRADAMDQLPALPVLLFGVETFHLGVVSLERYQGIIEGPARAAKRKVERAWPGRQAHWPVRCRQAISVSMRRSRRHKPQLAMG
jgi:hypothetical protein